MIYPPDPKYYPQCKFLTGGWSTHWNYKEGVTSLNTAIANAHHLAKMYIFTRVIDEHDVVVWVNKGTV